MALTLPYPTLGPGFVNASEINANFTAVSQKFSNIDNADIKASAGVEVSKLSASNYEIVLTRTIDGSATAAEGLDAAAGTRFIVGSVPYDTANTTYTITAIDTMTYAAANTVTEAVFTLWHGTDAQLIAGTATSIKTGITTGPGDDTFLGTAISSFTTSITTSSTEPKFFVLQVTTQGTTWAATDSFGISIKLKKALRT
jgi:hypothetical protein